MIETFSTPPRGSCCKPHPDVAAEDVTWNTKIVPRFAFSCKTRDLTPCGGELSTNRQRINEFWRSLIRLFVSRFVGRIVPSPRSPPSTTHWCARRDPWGYCQVGQRPSELAGDRQIAARPAGQVAAGSAILPEQGGRQGSKRTLLFYRSAGIGRCRRPAEAELRQDLATLPEQTAPRPFINNTTPITFRGLQPHPPPAFHVEDVKVALQRARPGAAQAIQQPALVPAGELPDPPLESNCEIVLTTPRPFLHPPPRRPRPRRRRP